MFAPKDILVVDYSPTRSVSRCLFFPYQCKKHVSSFLFFSPKWNVGLQGHGCSISIPCQWMFAPKDILVVDYLPTRSVSRYLFLPYQCKKLASSFLFFSQKWDGGLKGHERSSSISCLKLQTPKDILVVDYSLLDYFYNVYFFLTSVKKTCVVIFVFQSKMKCRPLRAWVSQFYCLSMIVST
jgi:hypothetical protein